MAIGHEVIGNVTFKWLIKGHEKAKIPRVFPKEREKREQRADPPKKNNGAKKTDNVDWSQLRRQFYTREYQYINNLK